MSVYKRKGSDTYSFDFELYGARHTGNTGEPSKRKAEQFVADLKKTLKAAKSETSKPMNFGAAWSLYWQQVGQFHRNTGDTARSLEWLEINLGKGKMLSAISDADIAKLVAKRRGENVSPSTVNRTVTEPLRAILKRARDIWGQTVQRIQWKTHLLKEPQERVREATQDEETSFEAALRPDYVPLFRFAILTGCRMSEVVGLEWSRVDFFNRSFKVIGKGDKSRSIPMTNAVFDLLWSLKDHHPEAVFTYVAWKTRNGKSRAVRYPITVNGLKTQWRRAKRDAKVPDFRFHDTRHTAATRLVRATGNLKLAQKLLGHTELATTSRYSHVTEADLRAGLEAANPTKSPAQDSDIGDKAMKDKGNVL